jgi:hypothetical protein
MAPAAAHAVEGIISPIDVDSIPPFWRRKNGILLYFLLTSSLLASAALGIDGVSHAPLNPNVFHLTKLLFD